VRASPTTPATNRRHLLDYPRSASSSASSSRSRFARTVRRSRPNVDRDHPELERLWVLDQADRQKLDGTLPAAEAETAIRNLGVTYQIVTD